MSQRCEGKTLVGDRCQHMTRSGKYCWQHQGQISDISGDKKKTFLEYYAKQMTTVEAAAAHAGVSSRAVRYWRERDPQFAEEYRKAKEQQNEHRARKLAQSALQQCVKGEASASLHIYMLKVYGGTKFRQADQKVVEERDRSMDPAMRDLMERRKEELEEIKREAEKGIRDAHE